MAASIGSSFVNLTEDTPLLTCSSQADPYSRSKAIAYSIVLAARNPDLRIISLRLMGVYEKRDNSLISSALNVLRQGWQRYQLRDNHSLMWCCIRNQRSRSTYSSRQSITRWHVKGGRRSFLYLRWLTRILLDFLRSSTNDSKRSYVTGSVYQRFRSGACSPERVRWSGHIESAR
jgi:nucleoside-diphosphate-sugar epimerase